MVTVKALSYPRDNKRDKATSRANTVNDRSQATNGDQGQKATQGQTANNNRGGQGGGMTVGVGYNGLIRTTRIITSNITKAPSLRVKRDRHLQTDVYRSPRKTNKQTPDNSTAGES